MMTFPTLGDVPPVLRQDLELLVTNNAADGTPNWILHDPLSNRFYFLSEHDAELLPYIEHADIEQAALQASQRLKRDVTDEDIETLRHFLRQHQLVLADSTQETLFAERNAQKPSWFSKVAKSYLFFRLPIWKPDRFLTRTLPTVEKIFNFYTLSLIAIFAVIGIYLALRQSDLFFASFLHLFSIEGFATYLAAIVIVKTLHEFGHAYMAKKQGCKVSVMGIAFLVGFPVLYTDTTDSWRLMSRRKRMSIGIAGVGVEILVAAIAIFAWSLMPDGVLRSVTFLIATTTWLISIFINLNPLMRFDGYYLLSDWWQIPNLEPRSHALGRWKLRKFLLGIDIPPPETPQLKMLIYSYSIWIYRFFLFLGIALLVYYFFFKALGILLFVIEIIYFIGRPIWNEVMAWWQLKEHLSWNKHTVRTVILITLGLGIFFVPWSSSIDMPAELQHEYSTVYVPVGGQLEQHNLVNNRLLKRNSVLAVLSNSDIEFQIKQAELKIADLEWQHSHLGFDSEMRSRATSITSELAAQLRTLEGLIKQQQQLTIRSENAGIVTDISPDLQVGNWLGEGEALFALRQPNDPSVNAYINEDDLQRVGIGGEAVFYPEEPEWPAVNLTLQRIEEFPIEALDSPNLSSTIGGALATREDDNGRLVPVESIHRLRLLPTALHQQHHSSLRGTVVINAKPESIFAGIQRRIVNILQQESVL